MTADEDEEENEDEDDSDDEDVTIGALRTHIICSTNRDDRSFEPSGCYRTKCSVGHMSLQRAVFWMTAVFLGDLAFGIGICLVVFQFHFLAV